MRFLLYIARCLGIYNDDDMENYYYRKIEQEMHRQQKILEKITRG